MPFLALSPYFNITRRKAHFLHVMLKSWKREPKGNRLLLCHSAIIILLDLPVKYYVNTYSLAFYVNVNAYLCMLNVYNIRVFIDVIFHLC